jgi:hypothetical protein
MDSYMAINSKGSCNVSKNQIVFEAVEGTAMLFHRGRLPSGFPALSQ